MSVFSQHFYHGMIKRYTIALGTLFSDMTLVRYKPDGSEDHRIKIPLAYSNKEKFVQRLTEDPDHSRKTAISLPRMAFEMVSLNYDGQRKLQKLRSHRYSDGGESSAKVFTPVPYDIVYNLYIVTKTQEEMLQIVEQILPGFTPDLTLSIHGIETPQTTYDVPITILDVQPSDTFEGSFEDRRQIMWSISFLVKAVLFGPIIEKKLIDTTNVTLKDLDDNDVMYGEIEDT